MTRAEAYLLLMNEFKKQNFSYDIKDSGFRGNLACFIEAYIDSKEWNGIYDTIIGYLEKRDLNEACYYISNLLHVVAVKVSNKDPFLDSVNTLQKNRFEVLYKEKDLDEFLYFPFQCYPDWYYEVSFAFDC